MRQSITEQVPRSFFWVINFRTESQPGTIQRANWTKIIVQTLGIVYVPFHRWWLCKYPKWFDDDLLKAILRKNKLYMRCQYLLLQSDYKAYEKRNLCNQPDYIHFQASFSVSPDIMDSIIFLDVLFSHRFTTQEVLNKPLMIVFLSATSLMAQRSFDVRYSSKA